MRYQESEIKVAIYCRLSEEDRDKRHEIDDSRSIQNQKSMLLSYAQTNRWTVYKIYSDDDYTGADRRRPAFNALLKDAEAGKFQVILCKSQSRFTRELELVEKYLHDLFPAWGIRFIGLVDNADTANRGNKKARQINGLVNEWYLEDLSDNIKEVLTDRRKKDTISELLLRMDIKKIRSTKDICFRMIQLPLLYIAFLKCMLPALEKVRLREY